MKDDVESIAEGSDGEYNYDPDDQLQPEDTLDDRGVDDILDEGISPPEKPSSATRYGVTAEEQREGESLDQHLAEEEPDPATEVASDAGIDAGAASAEEAAVHTVPSDQLP